MSDPLAAARVAFLEGVARFEAGDVAAAAEHFEAALRLAPGRVSVLVNLGAARLALGAPGAALAALDAALAAEDGHADAWSHRGQALAALGREDEALASFERALALDPAMSAAAYGRATSLSAAGRHPAALQALESLLHSNPAHGAGWLLHGRTLQMLERHGESLASYRRAVAAQPDLGLAWLLLGQGLAEQGAKDEAADAFRRTIALGFEPETGRYLLAALGRGAAPSHAPHAYVQALFDGYAGDFETHLVQGLRYRGHEHVARAALQGDHGVPRRAASALDLGCGTGLCGALLRPQVQWLGGVDLSGTMIDAARERGVFDELTQAELVAHLQATPHRHDLVVCADTFIYLGDLAPALAAVRRVLLAGGRFVFSVERGRDDEPDFALGSQLRYTHSERYLRALAVAHGFAVDEVQAVVLREEQQRSVPGLVLTWRV